MPENIQKRFLPNLFRSLKEGMPVSDTEFDYIFSKDLRRMSPINWTPVKVAIAAAKMLAKDESCKVLDVGSGAGKFCLIGAATCPGQFFGIEQRLNLLMESQKIQLFYGIENLTLMRGNAMEIDWTPYNAFYFFNPFLENITGFNTIGDDFPVEYENYRHYIAITRRKLASLPAGTRVVTYHGFGGDVPSGYNLETKQKIGTSFLKCWLKK